jgi:hypothetical protein
MGISVSVNREPSGRPIARLANLDGDQNEKLHTLSINTIRTLAMDAVQAANSGHPGTPMALAPVVYCLWQQFLRFDPQDPIWPNRDRSYYPSATPRCCFIRSSI